MNWNEIWIVFEVTPEYTFTQVYHNEEQAIEHVGMRLASLARSNVIDMQGREIYYKKYVVLE